MSTTTFSPPMERAVDFARTQLGSAILVAAVAPVKVRGEDGFSLEIGFHGSGPAEVEQVARALVDFLVEASEKVEAEHACDNCRNRTERLKLAQAALSGAFDVKGHA